MFHTQIMHKSWALAKRASRFPLKEAQYNLLVGRQPPARVYTLLMLTFHSASLSSTAAWHSPAHPTSPNAGLHPLRSFQRKEAVFIPEPPLHIMTPSPQLNSSLLFFMHSVSPISYAIAHNKCASFSFHSSMRPSRHLLNHQVFTKHPNMTGTCTW